MANISSVETPSISPELAKVRDRLYYEGFSKVYRDEGRPTVLMVDGARVSIKFASSSSKGQWIANLHVHGKLTEKGIDAYLFVLRDVPGNSAHPLYVLMSAPLRRSGINFSVNSLLTTYSRHVSAFGDLKEIVKRKKRKG